MHNVVVLGLQWGDEGKGKIVDYLANQADVVVRFQGGHNAGHTLVIDQQVYKLSLLPSCIVRPGKMAIIGNGVVLDPWALFKEIDTLTERGINISPKNLAIADNACLILPLHAELDRHREELQGGNKIGTTGRGIGPAYEDKVGRRAIRAGDLLQSDFLKQRINNLLSHHNALRQGLNMPIIEESVLFNQITDITQRLTPFVTSTVQLLQHYQQQKRHILFEGAQGALLDIDHGTYPYVTSSNTLTGQVFSGAGFYSPAAVLGVIKAYTTRVGQGPFPTEDLGDIGQKMREIGHEFGTVTGRKRRCGWFDATLVRQIVRLSGAKGLVLTKLDVLDDFDKINIGVGYEILGKSYDYLPSSLQLQQQARPIYRQVSGWKSSLKGCRDWSKLPTAAKNYIQVIEEFVGVPIFMISTSPEREDIIVRQNVFSL